MKAILTFHSLDDSGSVLSYRPRMFAELLQALMQSGIEICTLPDLLEKTEGAAVALSFDDGMRSVFEYALPVLREARVPAHLFLTTGRVGRDNSWPGQPPGAPRFEFMSWPQIEACQQVGMLVEGHTAQHPDLCALDASAVLAECEAADAEIEQRLGRRPEHFAYPYGSVNRELARFAAQRYRCSVTTELRALSARDPRELLPRLDSYYLQHAWLVKNPLSRSALTYLGGRNLLRRLKAVLSR